MNGIEGTRVCNWCNLFAVRAIVDTKIFFKMERLVVAFLMLVTNYFVGARNYAAGTTCA